MYLGLLTFLSLTITAVIGYNVLKGKTKFKYHTLFVYISFALMIIHGILGVALFI